MKKLLSIVLCLILAFSTTCPITATAANDAAIEGSWLMVDDDEIMFQFRKDGSGVYADGYEVVAYTFLYDEETHSLEFPESDSGELENFNFQCYICGNGMILVVSETGYYEDEEPEIYLMRRL